MDVERHFDFFFFFFLFLSIVVFIGDKSRGKILHSRVLDRVPHSFILLSLCAYSLVPK